MIADPSTRLQRIHAKSSATAQTLYRIKNNKDIYVSERRRSDFHLRFCECLSEVYPHLTTQSIPLCHSGERQM